MEEKERYEYFFGTNTIKDNKANQFYGCVVDLLNQQDKRIKELEEELENYKLCRCVDCSSEYEYGLETSIDELDKENQQLKQQLHDLPKKIVEEIRDDIAKRIMEKQIKWGDNTQIGFICNAINECLDAILKKFGG